MIINGSFANLINSLIAPTAFAWVKVGAIIVSRNLVSCPIQPAAEFWRVSGHRAKTHWSPVCKGYMKENWV